MTDTSTVPATPTTNPVSSAANLSESLNSALRAAPELGQSPGTAVAVAGSADPVGNAQAVARGTQAIATAQAGNRVAKSAGPIGGVLGWFGHVATTALDDVAQAPSDIGNAAMKGMQDVGTVLNKPLSTVQHEYRYLHDVEARYGPEAALTAGLGLAVGGAAGFVAGGISGAVLGGEGAEALEGQFLYHDSWNNTANGNTYRDPNTHQQVSIGRDIASFITGSRTGIGYNAISAVADGLFDITADPLQQAGSLVGQAKSLEGASGKLGDLFGGTGIHAGSRTPEDVERIFRQYPSVRNAADQIAGMTPGEIVARYPQLSPVAQRLGAASTADEVQQVFEQVFRAGELITTDRLPSMSFTHLALQKIRYGLANAPQLGDLAGQVTNSTKLAKLGDLAEHAVGPSTLMRRFERTATVYNPDNFSFSAREFKAGDDYGAAGIYSLLRLGEAPHVAEDVVTEYLNNPNTGRRIQIFRNALMNALAAKAHLDPAEFGEYANDDTRSAMKEVLDTLTRGSLPGVSGHYGNAIGGDDLSKVVTEDGARHAAAVLPNQTGNLRIPSAREFRNAAKVLSGARDTWGKIDDFAYRNVTQSVFKRLVLLTMGYAERISLAEIIPNGFREGFTSLIRSGIQLNRALGPLSAEDAEVHVGAIRSIVFKLLRMDRGEVPSNEDVQLASRYVQMLHGETLPGAIDSGHNISNEVKDVDQTEHLVRAVYHNSPKVLKYAKDFGEYGRPDEHFVDAWQKVLHEMSLQPDNEVVRQGAQEYLNAAKGTATEEVPFEIPQADMYHGTPRELPNGTLNPDRYGAGASTNLFGPGVYTTENPNVALTYTGKGARGAERIGELNKTVYGLHWNGAEPPNLLDLETRAPEDLREAFRDVILGPHAGSLLDEATEASAADLERLVADPSATGADLYKAFSTALGSAGVTREEADEAFHALTDQIETAGYDGFRYQGGIRAASTGSPTHEARVFFDPSKLTIDQGTAVRRTIERPLTKAEAEQHAVKTMTDYFNGKDENWLSQYERHYLHSSIDVPPTMSYEEDWSRVMMEHLKGATHSPDGTPNVSLLSHIANGEKVPTDELDAIGTNDRPLVVKGRNMVSSGEGALNRVTNAIANPVFGKILNPFVNLMSREPLAFAEFKNQWELVKDAEDMTEDEKMVTAMQRTATRSVRFIHNLNDRTQWTDTMRNWAPFYFAQEQAYRRMARMLAENPGAFRRYQMMITALQNFSVRQQSANGSEYIVLPGTGFLTSGVVSALARIPGIGKEIQSAAPVGMGWDVSAANVIFPLSNGFRPDVGPVLSLPAEAVADLFPEQASPSIKSSLTGIATAIGGPESTEPIWEQLIPNTIVQRLAVAANANSSTFDSAFISTMQALEYNHEIPPEDAGPVAMQNFLDKVQNQTRILFVMKALVGAVTPVSPELQAQDHNFPAELEADINRTGSAILGTQEFLAKNPNATPWTVFRSHATTGISPLSTQPAEDWVNSHIGLAQTYGYAWLYFMPQLKNGTYSAEVYNEQIAQSLRTKYTPQEYLNQLYVMGANNTYYANLATYDDYVQKNGLSGTQLYNAEQNFLNWEAGFAAQHPIWAQEYYTPGDFASDRTTSTDRVQAIKQMQEMVSSGVAPPGSMTDGIKTLLDGYANYTNAIAVGKQDNYTSSENYQLTQNWQNYLTATAKAEPELSTVIGSVFMYAPKTGVGNG